ncbi:MAG: GHMP kinase [Deltaproteobacteria bacterium]|nr:GHMP kinase [Deltaproteobacteria bacterium]
MIITQTPLRISFAGGGTDFREFWQKHGGCVVNSAIDKYVYVIIKERFDDLIVLNYSKREIVKTVDEINHDLLRESMKKTGVEKGVEITTLADIPSEGSGLGSSSSITVGFLHAMYTYQGELVTAERLAREACEIEIDILGSPIGMQDQYIAAYGGIKSFNFNKDGEIRVEALNLAPWDQLILSSRLLLFYLNRTRKANTILKEQWSNIDQKTDILIRMRDLAFDLRYNLNAESLDILGKVMDKGWMLKKTLASRISDPEIDALYKRALDAGALGGKVAGAGGGGFLLLYVPRDKQDGLRKSLGRLRELPFMIDLDGSKVIFNNRSRKWK